jgi:hypothetical protein
MLGSGEKGGETQQISTREIDCNQGFINMLQQTHH